MDFVYYHHMTSFAEWIDHELQQRGWSRSEAARRGDFSPYMLDKVINGATKPGLSFLKKLSQAFGISLVEVLEHAGVYEKPPTQNQWDDIFARLTPEDQAEMLEIARIKLNKNRPNLKIDTSPLKPKPSESA